MVPRTILREGMLVSLMFLERQVHLSCVIL